MTFDYLKFDCFVDGVRTIVDSPLRLAREDYARICAIATGFDRLIRKTCNACLDDRGLRDYFGFSREIELMTEAERSRSARFANDGVQRYDFFKTSESRWMISEFNTDAPGGHNETAGLNALAKSNVEGTREWGGSPLMDAIFKRVCKNKPVPKVAVVYATGYAEDMQVCRFIADFLTRRGAIARLGSPANLKISRGRLTLFGENIDIVYRFFPIEWMDELPNLRRLVSAYAAGNFEMINGFGQVFAQSKKISSFWREHPEVLTAAERRLVSAHIPRTELFSRSRADFYEANRDALVLKHQFGRMGEEVAIGRFYTDAEWAAEVAEVAKAPLDWTVQEFFDAAPVEIEGRMFFPCYGLYVVDGKPVDVYCRVSPFRQTCYDALNVGAYLG